MALVWCFLHPPSCLQKSLLRLGDIPRPALCLRLQKSLPPSYISHLGPPPISVKVEVAQLCPTLCDSMDYRVHGILQVRILECVTVPFSRGSSQSRDQTQVPRIAGRFFTV